MKVLYDARFITPQHTGVGGVCAWQLQHLLQAGENLSIHVLYHGFLDPALKGSYPLKAPVAFDDHPMGDLYRNFGLKRELRRRGVCLVHNPAFYCIQRNRNLRQITAIHDTAVFDVPQFFPTRFAKYFRWVIRSAVQNSDLIVTASDFTTSRLGLLFEKSMGKIRMIPYGIPEIYRKRDLESDESVRMRWAIHRPYIFAVSTIEERKNLMVLLNAYAIYRRRFAQPYDLLIAGKKGSGADRIEHRANQSDMGCSVRLLGYISLEEMASMYRMAAFTVYPSLYEGFGLPVLEAMASGSPVIASNTSALPEVTRDAAYLFDPRSELELSDAMIRLSENPDLIASLKDKGINLSDQFSWDVSVARVVSLYRELL